MTDLQEHPITPQHDTGADADPDKQTPIDTSGATNTDRRSVLRRLALGSVGAAAGAVVLGQTASAGDSESATDIGGNALELGDDVVNTSASPTSLSYTGADQLTDASVVSVGTDGPNATDGNNVFPGALGGYGKGVVPTGVHGSTVSPLGAGVVAAHLAPAQAADAEPQAAAAAGLIVASVGGPQIKFVGLDGAVAGPTTGVHAPGELYADADGTLWFTVPAPTAPDTPTDDSPGADAAALVIGDVRFVKLAGTPTAGQFHTLPVPKRIFDSREGATPTKLGLDTITELDMTKTFTGGESGFPVGSITAVINITLERTVGVGFARIVSTGTDLADVETSNINWYSDEQTVANQATVGVSSGGGVTVDVGGTPGSATHLIVDLQGYYL